MTIENEESQIQVTPEQIETDDIISEESTQVEDLKQRSFFQKALVCVGCFIGWILFTIIVDPPQIIGLVAAGVIVYICRRVLRA